MQRDIGQMVAAGAQSVELAVEHVGEPRERMPIRGVAAGEGPRNPVGRHAALYMRVLINVFIVVVVDEREIGRPSEDDRNRQQEKNANGRCRVDLAACRP